MKKRFTEEQIVGILRKAEVPGVQIREVCRKHNLTEQTFFRWRNQYGGLEVGGYPVTERHRVGGRPAGEAGG